MKKIKFSVCIPNYNYAGFVNKTIQSVLDQDYDNFEILIADNSSTDSSVEVIRGFNDPRIHLKVNNFNVGFAPNLDKACEGATGDYMLLLSSDDLMKPGALSTFARLIEQHDGLNDPLVLCSSIDIIDENDSIKGHRFALMDPLVKGLKKENKNVEGEVVVYNGHDLLRHALNNFEIVGRFLSTCYSRKLFERVEGYRSITSIMPDAHFSHKLMFLNPRTIVVKESLFCYRVHSANNYAAIFQHVRLATDAYILTNLYSEVLLKPIGMSSISFKESFTRHWGHLKILSLSIAGKISYSLKLWHLVWASYPKLYRKYFIAWTFPFLVPVLWILSKFLGIRSQFRKRS